MIFPAPRFVVVDDNEDHLIALQRAFQELGAPCLGIHYNEETGIGAQDHLRGVRVLCLDLHLTHDLLYTTDPARHFALIAELLETNISRTGGPFILVVWTAHEEEVANLGQYLDQAFSTSAPHALPLKILPLAKTRFISKTDGELLTGAAGELREALLNAVNDVPQLAALLEWETDVQAATGATLSALTESVPQDQRSIEHVAGGLGTVLAHLGAAAAGEDRARSDAHAAVSSALVPLLADQVLHREPPEQQSGSWKAATVGSYSSSLQPEANAKLNRMVHLAPGTGALGADTWGAVVDLPEAWQDDAQLRSRFGVEQAHLAQQEFKLRSDTLQNPRLVRIGAVCDYVLARPGPLTYLLGVEVPDGASSGKPPESVWRSPALLRHSDEGPFELRFSARFPVVAAREDVVDWRPIYRLREQLLMHLVTHSGSYLSRPGVLRLPPAIRPA